MALNEAQPGGEHAKNDPFAPKPPPPGAITEDDEAEFGSNLAAQALAFASQAPPLRVGSSSTQPSASGGAKPAAAPAPAKAPSPVAAPAAAPAAPAAHARTANPFATNPAAEEAGDDDEIFGGSNLAAAALAFAAQAPPLHGSTRDAQERHAAPAAQHLHAEPPPLARASGSPVAAGACQVVESRDGHKVLWDVVFPSGGGVVVILTPRRSTPAELRPLPAHVSWRSADAISAGDTEAFAQVLSRAASQAQALPVAALRA